MTGPDPHPGIWESMAANEHGQDPFQPAADPRVEAARELLAKTAEAPDALVTVLTRYRETVTDLLDLVAELGDPGRPGVAQPGGGWISGPSS